MINEGAIREIYNQLISVIPEDYRILAGLTIFTLLIVAYLLFVWKFHKFLAKRDILDLNLAKYNTSKDPLKNKINAFLLYVLEYIVIVPVMVFFLFFVLAVFLLVLSKSNSVGQILLISAAVIAATRIISYIKEEVSQELAKMLPLTLLLIFVLEPDSFNLNLIFERIAQIPSLFENIIIFLVFIITIELIMRLVFFFIDLIYTGNTE